MNALNKPSFFRKGGVAVIGGQKTTAGRNADGSYFIDIAGRDCARAHLTPQQTFDLAKGLLDALGYRLEIGNGPQQ